MSNTKSKTKKPVRYMSVQRLRENGACWKACQKVEKLFGTSRISFTKENLMLAADNELRIAWLTRCIPNVRSYSRAQRTIDVAYNNFHRAVAPLEADYMKKVDAVRALETAKKGKAHEKRMNKRSPFGKAASNAYAKELREINDETQKDLRELQLNYNWQTKQHIRTREAAIADMLIKYLKGKVFR